MEDNACKDLATPSPRLDDTLAYRTVDEIADVSVYFSADDRSPETKESADVTVPPLAPSAPPPVFDDNENSVDEHDLVIDDEALQQEGDADAETKKDDERKQAQADCEEDKIENYSSVLGGPLPEGSSEVMLQMEDRSVEAIHIGDGVYIYKNDDGELTAMQVVYADDGSPVIKNLHVGKNEDGNLEVYEEQISQVAVTGEELEAMKRKDGEAKSDESEKVKDGEADPKRLPAVREPSETIAAVADVSIENRDGSVAIDDSTIASVSEPPAIPDETPSSLQASDEAPIVPDGTSIVSDEAPIVPDEASTISDETSTIPDEALIVSNETAVDVLRDGPSGDGISSLVEEKVSEDVLRKSDDQVDDNRLQIVEDEGPEPVADDAADEFGECVEPSPTVSEEDGVELPESSERFDQPESDAGAASVDASPIRVSNDPEPSAIVDALETDGEHLRNAIAAPSVSEEVDVENPKIVTMLENDGVVTLSIESDGFLSEENDHLLRKMEENLQEDAAGGDASAVDRYLRDADLSSKAARAREESRLSAESDDENVVEGEPITGDSDVGWIGSFPNSIGTREAVASPAENFRIDRRVDDGNGPTVRISDVDESFYIVPADGPETVDDVSIDEIHRAVGSGIVELDFDKFVRNNSIKLTDERIDRRESGAPDLKNSIGVADEKRFSVGADDYLNVSKPAAFYAPVETETVKNSSSPSYETISGRKESENIYASRFSNSNSAPPKTYLQRNRTPFHKKNASHSILTNMNLNNSKVEMKFINSPEKNPLYRNFSYTEPKSNITLTCTSTPKLKTYPAPQKNKSHDRDQSSPSAKNVVEKNILSYNLYIERSNSDSTNLVPITKSDSVKFPTEENNVRSLKDISDNNLSCMSISDTEPQSSADESSTSELIKQSKCRQPRKQIFTPVAQSDIEIIFPAICNTAKEKSLTKPIKKYKIFSAKQAQLEAEEKLQQELKNNRSSESKEDFNMNEKKNIPDENKNDSNEDIEQNIVALREKETSGEGLEVEIVKRKRGRPKKNVSLCLDSSSASSLSVDNSVCKIMESNRKTLPPQLKKLAPSRPDNIVRSKSLSPFGKINDTIVCPICFKTFRTQNVLLKHVKHCTGTIDKELAKLPKKRKSENPESTHKTKDKLQKANDKHLKTTKTEENVRDLKVTNELLRNSPTFNKKTKYLNSLKLDNSLETTKTDNRAKQIDGAHESSATNQLVENTKNIIESTSPSKYVSSIPEQMKIGTKKNNELMATSPSKSENCEDTICINPKKLMLQKSMIESEARENQAQLATQNLDAKTENVKNIEKRLSTLKDNLKKSDKPKISVVNKKMAVTQKPVVASPLSRLAKILNTKPPANAVISCEVCGKTFRQLAHMVYHRNKHSVDDKSVVEKPDRLKKNTDKSDQQNPEENSILKCDVCQKGFRKLHHLVEHREVHLTTETKSRRTSTASVKSEPEAGFRCDTCDKSFRKLHHLVEHRELHTTEGNELASKPIEESKNEISNTTCSGCGKNFRKRHHMVEHRDIHCSPTKKGKTNDAEQADEFNVRLSVGSSTSDESNNCGICGKSYRKLYHMVEHRESHNEASRLETLKTKDIIHECAKCYMVFPNENSLNKHTTICAKRKSIHPRRACTSLPQKDISRRLDFGKHLKKKPPSIHSNSDTEDVIIISEEPVVKKESSKPAEPEKKNTPTLNENKANDEPDKKNDNTSATERKSNTKLNNIKQVDPINKKPNRRLSQPSQTKPTLNTVKRRKSDLSISKSTTTKTSKSITEESNVRYSFPKSTKTKEKDTKKSEKTDSKVILNEKPSNDKKVVDVKEKRKVGRPSLQPKLAPNQNNTKPVVKKPMVKPATFVTSRRTSLGSRKSLGGRKSLNSKALPKVAKKEPVKKIERQIKPSVPVKGKNCKCDCGKAFDNEVLLKRHIDSEHTPPKSYRCATCGTSVRTAAQYAKHKQDHLKQQAAKPSQSGIASKVKKTPLRNTLRRGIPNKVPENGLKKPNPPTSTKKTIKKRAAHSGVPLSDKMKKAIAGAKF